MKRGQHQTMDLKLQCCLNLVYDYILILLIPLRSRSFHVALMQIKNQLCEKLKKYQESQWRWRSTLVLNRTNNDKKRFTIHNYKIKSCILCIKKEREERSLECFIRRSVNKGKDHYDLYQDPLRLNKNANKGSGCQLLISHQEWIEKQRLRRWIRRGMTYPSLEFIRLAHRSLSSLHQWQHKSVKKLE